MKRLLIATTNPAKLAEYRLLMRDLPLELVSLADLSISESPEESGETFAANASLKARFYFERSRVPVLADDGGLEVDALDGAPGVRSHRWLGEAASDDRSLANEVVRRLEGIPPNRRIARLKAAAALVWDDGVDLHERIASAALEGVIASRVYDRIEPGFPYRAVLFLPGIDKYLAQLNEEQAAALSQRHSLIDQLRPPLAEIARLL